MPPGRSARACGLSGLPAGGAHRHSRMIRTRHRARAGLVAAPLSAGGGPPPDAEGPRPIGAAQAAEAFDSAWTRIRDTHYDPALRGVAWEAVRRELRPRAERAGTVGALRAVLADMLGRLGESHFVLIPQDAVEALDAGDVS